MNVKKDIQCTDVKNFYFAKTLYIQAKTIHSFIQKHINPLITFTCAS